MTTNFVMMSVLHDEPRNLARREYVTSLFSEPQWKLPQGKVVVGQMVDVRRQSTGYGFACASVVKVIDPVQPVVEVVEHKPFVTVLHGMSGFFAAFMTYDAEMDDYDVWNTGIGRYSTSVEAERAGRAWAADEEVEFKA